MARFYAARNLFIAGKWLKLGEEIDVTGYRTGAVNAMLESGDIFLDSSYSSLDKPVIPSAAPPANDTIWAFKELVNADFGPTGQGWSDDGFLLVKSDNDSGSNGLPSYEVDQFSVDGSGTLEIASPAAPSTYTYWNLHTAAALGETFDFTHSLSWVGGIMMYSYFTSFDTDAQVEAMMTPYGSRSDNTEVTGPDSYWSGAVRFEAQEMLFRHQQQGGMLRTKWWLPGEPEPGWITETPAMTEDVYITMNLTLLGGDFPMSSVTISPIVNSAPENRPNRTLTNGVWI